MGLTPGARRFKHPFAAASLSLSLLTCEMGTELLDRSYELHAQNLAHGALRGPELVQGVRALALPHAAYLPRGTGHRPPPPRGILLMTGFLSRVWQNSEPTQVGMTVSPCVQHMPGALLELSFKCPQQLVDMGITSPHYR